MRHFNYLGLNEVRQSREQGNEAHKRRMSEVRKHKMYTRDDSYEQLKLQQHVNNRKRELLKWQHIQEENNKLLKRLVRINSRLPTPPSQQGTPRGKKSQSERKQMIENENRRLYGKITDIQSPLNGDQFRQSFLQHTKYKSIMQKFQVNNHSVKLRADIFLDSMQQKSRAISMSQQHGRIHSRIVEQPKGRTLRISGHC